MAIAHLYLNQGIQRVKGYKKNYGNVIKRALSNSFPSPKLNLSLGLRMFTGETPLLH